MPERVTIILPRRHKPLKRKKPKKIWIRVIEGVFYEITKPKEFFLTNTKSYTNIYKLLKLFKIKQKINKIITKCLLLNLTSYKSSYFYGNCLQKLLIIFSTVDLKFGFAIWPLNLTTSKFLTFEKGYNFFY